MIDFTCNSKDLAEVERSLKECMDLLDKDGSLNGANILRGLWLESSLMYQILKFTNFDAVLQDLKVSYHSSDLPFIHRVLAKMRTNNDPITVKRLIERINEEVNVIGKEPLKVFSFFIPCRLDIELEADEKETLYQIFLEVTGIQILDRYTDQFLAQIKEGKFKQFFTGSRRILRVDVEARDLVYADSLVEKKLHFFLGTIGFSNYYKQTTIAHWSISGDDSYCENIVEKRVVVFVNDKLVFPDAKIFPALEMQIKEDELSILFKEVWAIHNKSNGNYNDLCQMLSFCKSKDAERSQVLQNALRVYFSAITEKIPELAFLKYWITFEILLKKGKKTKGFGPILESWKKWQRRYPEKTIDLLYEKRCNVAHEFKTDFITYQDANFAKDIAETTLLNIDKIWNNNL